MEDVRISRFAYSWERPSKKRRGKPFYRRWWVVIPVGLVVICALVAWITWEVVRFQFEKKAEVYDLETMTRMEAASLLFDRNGAEFGKLFIQNRQPVTIDRISPNMVNAVIAAEDNHFRSHRGVDWMGIVRAAIANYRKGRIAQGASTVTQQLARNSFELRERTYQRKLVEMFLAQRIEARFSKDQIMEMYLNRVYFGSGFYGVEAAARGYFGRSARELDLGQSAMLAGLLKSPQALSPWNNLEAAQGARNFVLGRMRELGMIKRDQYNQEVKVPLYVLKRTNPFKVSYAVDFIRQQAIAALGFERAMNGGFRIYTTLDSGIQRAAERAARAALEKIETTPNFPHQTYATFREQVKDIEDAINRGNMSVKMPEPRYLQAAVLALDNETGAILAMVGGRDFKHSEYNRALQARRPIGTGFTPFVFAAAFEKGLFPGSIVQDACLDNRYVMVGGETGILGEWGVERKDNDYEGPIPAREALVKGKNAATVRVGLETGIGSLQALTKRAGISSPVRNYANAFLGSSEMTLEEVTLGYTTFPNGGWRPSQPFIIERITNAEGDLIYSAKPEKTEVLPRAAAFQVHAALRQALRSGVVGQAATSAGLGNFPAAGKSGTAYNFTDTYFFGYSQAVTCGVWVGFDRPTKIFRGAFGKDLALPIWAEVMNAANEDFPAKDLPKPAELTEVQICRASGLLATPKCHHPDGRSDTYTEFATKAQLPQIRCDVHGGGIRDYTKVYSEEEWPRAAAAVDLATIRPVAVLAPTLLGLNDVYQSVKPTAANTDDGEIPVAKALPVDGSEATADAVNTPEAQAQAVAAATIAPVTVQETEVRKAEAVSPKESLMDTPVIRAKQPEPINF